MPKTGPEIPETPEIKKETKQNTDEEVSGFECNICLAPAQRPVVTLCGHLYCWPCLYKWLNHSRKGECPVCKGGVTDTNVIPIYGRGRSHKDPRRSTTAVPERPRAQRSSSPGAPPFTGGLVRQIQIPLHTGSVGISAGFGLFPSLFGTNPPEANGVLNENRRDFAREQQEQLSRMLLFLGSLVILCLLMF